MDFPIPPSFWWSTDKFRRISISHKILTTVEISNAVHGAHGEVSISLSYKISSISKSVSPWSSLSLCCPCQTDERFGHGTCCKAISAGNTITESLQNLAHINQATIDGRGLFFVWSAMTSYNTQLSKTWWQSSLACHTSQGSRFGPKLQLGRPLWTHCTYLLLRRNSSSYENFRS